MKPFARSERVGEQIKKTIADLLQRRIRDPRLEMVTITDVRMTADLKIARIYFVTPNGASDVERVSQGFKSSHGFIKRKMARRLRLRYMPELQFYYDGSFDYGAHIEKLLKSIKSTSRGETDTFIYDGRTNCTTNQTE